MWWHSWLRHCTTSRRSWVRSPMVLLEFFIHIILLITLWPWGRLSLLTEISTRGISWGVKVDGVYGWQPHHLHVPIVMMSGSLNLLEPSGPVQAYPRGCFTFPFHTWWHIWLRHCATSRKVAGSIPDCAIGIFHSHNPSSHTMALGLTQPLTEMSTRIISWG